MKLLIYRFVEFIEFLIFNFAILILLGETKEVVAENSAEPCHRFM